jgi:DNA-nicking Smr family endonuclease
MPGALPAPTDVMARLTELKSLLDAAKAAPASASAAPRRTADAAPAGTRVPAASAAKPDGPASPKRAIAAAKHADGDIDLARAFADVAKLPPANRAIHDRPPPAPIPRQRIADERDVLEASKYGEEPAPQSWDAGQEYEHEQTFVRGGIGPDVVGKLRRGHWSIQAEIDLHGMTAIEAHDALADFLDEARGRGLRCVRVIHGKGLTSPNKEPVLKGKVRRWLAHWDDVLAYAEAPQHAGGGGAVLVLLRGR